MKHKVKAFALVTLSLILVFILSLMASHGVTYVKELLVAITIPLAIYIVIVFIILSAIVIIAHIIPFIWNRFPVLSRKKYERHIPDIHPALVSILDKNGAFSMKRIISSSLLHLIAIGTITVKKHKNTHGETTLSFAVNKTDNSDAIDKIILRFLDFIATDRLLDRLPERAKELESYDGLYPHALNIVLLADFPLVAEKKKKEFNEYIDYMTEEILKEIRHKKLYSSLGHLIFMRFIIISIVLSGALSALTYILFLGLFIPSRPESLHLIETPTNLLSLIGCFLIPIGLVFTPLTSLNYILFSRTAYAYKAEVKNLKRWLKDFTLLKEKDTMAVTIWQEYMAYAAALGIPLPAYSDISLILDTINTTFSSASIHDFLLSTNNYI